MSTPAPRESFKTDEEYYRAFWQMSELGVDLTDYEFFKYFFLAGCVRKPKKKISLV